MSNRREPLSLREQISVEQAWRVAHALEEAEAVWWESMRRRAGEVDVADSPSCGKRDRWAEWKSRAVAVSAVSSFTSFVASRTVLVHTSAMYVAGSAAASVFTVITATLWMRGNTRWQTFWAVLSGRSRSTPARGYSPSWLPVWPTT